MTIFKHILAGFLVLVLSFGCSITKKITTKDTSCWVYKVVPVRSDQTLDALGRDGWEAFATTMMKTSEGFVLWASLRKPLQPCKAEPSKPSRLLQRLVPPS